MDVVIDLIGDCFGLISARIGRLLFGKRFAEHPGSASLLERAVAGIIAIALTGALVLALWFLLALVLRHL